MVNCLTGNSIPGERRNMLIESARIARGNVLPLSQFRAEDFVSTPAYMYDEAPLYEIFTGIRKFVDEVVRLS